MTVRHEILAEGVELYCGDCRNILPALKAAVCLTDPPYGMDYRSNYATDDLWLGGRRIVNDCSADVRNEALALIDAPKLVFGTRKVPEPESTRMVLVWDKGPALGMGAIDLPWKPSSEEIYVIGKGFCGSRDESNVLYCPPVQSMAKNGRLHPNEKPVALLQRLLKKCPPGPVIDPFMGSGSTGEAAIKSGRHFIGIEIEPKYFEVALKRIKQVVRQPDFFFQPGSK